METMKQPESPNPEPEPEAPEITPKAPLPRKRTPVTAEALAQFSGSEQYHPNGERGALVLSDGALFVRENAGKNGTGWLFDLIEQCQPITMKDPALSGIQFWRLETDPDTHKAILICDRDEGDEAFRIAIPDPVDFPLPVFRVWVQTTLIDHRRVSVAMLPSEY